MAYGDFKDLPTRTASDKVLSGKAFNVAKNPKFDGWQLGLDSMVYKFLIKKWWWQYKNWENVKPRISRRII